MSTLRTRTAAAVSAVAVTLVAGSCSAGSSSSDSASGSGGTDALTVGLVAEPASLDFTKTDGAAIPQALLVNVYEALVKLDQDGKIVPPLAKSWTVSRRPEDLHLRAASTTRSSATATRSPPTTRCSASSG